MTGRTVILSSEAARERAKADIDRAPPGYVASVREQTRTGDQNAKMWAMLTDISRAKPMDRRETPEMWKAILLSACGYEQQFCMGIDNRPFPLGFRTSRLTKSQMSDLIEFMLAWGTQNGVRWSDEAQQPEKG